MSKTTTQNSEEPKTICKKKSAPSKDTQLSLKEKTSPWKNKDFSWTKTWGKPQPMGEPRDKFPRRGGLH